MANVTTGDLTLRAENVDRIVKGFALRNYIFKGSLMLSTSNSWKETYYVETSTELTGGTGSAIKGVPRLAEFPYAEPTWYPTSKRHEKYAVRGVVSWEDVKTNEIDVIARTLLRLTRAVTKAVDDEIYSQISSLAGNTETVTAGSEWNSATIANRDPIQNVLNAIKLINIDNYDVLGQSGQLWLSPTDYANLLGNINVRNAGQFYTDSVTKNGNVGKLCGLTVKVSNSVTDDEAIVMIPKISGTWKQAVPLTTETIYNKLVNYEIRVAEIGVAQITNPNAICKISNTQA